MQFLMTDIGVNMFFSGGGWGGGCSPLKAQLQTSKRVSGGASQLFIE